MNYTSETGGYPTYTFDDTTKYDRLHHDQGPDGTINDTGYMTNETTLLDDTLHIRRCSVFTGYWFEDNVCAER